MRGLAAPALVVAVALAACGGGSSETPATKEAWVAEHGAAVADIGTALDRVQAATKEGEPTAIRANCEGLRDTVDEARSVPPVPEAAVDAALRKALDAIATGVGECVRAMSSGDVRQLERSITQLRQARLDLDTANAQLAA